MLPQHNLKTNINNKVDNVTNWMSSKICNCGYEIRNLCQFKTILLKFKFLYGFSHFTLDLFK